MSAPDFDALWVQAAARLAGLAIDAEQLPAVLANFERTVAIAAPLLALSLDEQDELGPVWRPPAAQR